MLHNFLHYSMAVEVAIEGIVRSHKAGKTTINRTRALLSVRSPDGDGAKTLRKSVTDVLRNHKPPGIKVKIGIEARLKLPDNQALTTQPHLTAFRATGIQ